jgi:UDP-3-O-[3-hydroxymyristoyl] N-acetylglucosamine deacetylase
LTLLPAPPDSGVKFLRTDVDLDHAVIAASWRNIVNSPLSTVLGNEHGVTVIAVEYLLAALRICGVDNVLIEVSGEEVPTIAPGDLSLVSLINRVGIVSQQLPRFGIWIERPIEARLCKQSALLNPSTKPTITAEIDLTGINTIDTRFVSVPLVDHVFAQEIFPVRGSGLGDQPYRLRAQHDSVNKAIASDDNSQINEARLQSADTIPVHMILRSLGCLVLAEMPVFGHLFVNSPKHRLTHALLREIFAHPEAWTRRSYTNICQQCNYDQGEVASRLH